ncbi:hypothetical protein [Erythrobacter sp. THAF29]|uniref:hypothetical protein n=1 Tax=Erythrobacter sp. THAF29 TaxID=2587851 RepID=UPI00126919B7|nr:hypothetical protein [Erythrobacter sp. THAF29]QFT77830.1 hypothetical protein FIU90_09815 [Erythrobacter sp. THAF29]
MAGDDDFEFAKSVNEKTIESSNAALRSLLVINGGAAVALLAFIGSIANQNEINLSSVLVALSFPLVLLGWGVAASVIAMMFAYFTNLMTVGHTFAEHDSREEGAYSVLKTGCHALAFLTAVGSLGLFVWAIYEVREAITLIAS